MAKKETGSKEKYRIEKKLVTPLDGPYLHYQNKRMLDFSSQDFLGLSQHPDVKKSAIRYTLKLGGGTLSDAFESLAQKQIEEKLAHLVGTEKVVLFNSFAELTSFLFNTMVSSESVVFSDQKLEVPHVQHIFSSLAQLQTLLSKVKLSSNLTHLICVSSSSFDLKTLSELAKGSHALLCFNDTENFGISGKRGLGFGAGQKDVDCVLASFEHSCGCYASYIATSSSLLKERPSIPPLIPSVLGVLDAVLNLLPDMEAERSQIEQYTTWLKAQLQEKGFASSPLKTPRVKLTLPSEQAAESLLNFFLENDIIVEHIEPKKIALSMTALHTPDDLDQLSTVLKKLSATDFALATQSSIPTP